MKKSISLMLAVCLLLSMVPFGGLFASAADVVNVQFWNADSGSTVTYADDSPAYVTYNYTEGSASLEIIAKEDNPNCVFYLFGGPADITGATHMAVDVWCQKDNQLNGAEGWTDMYIWSEANKGTLDWDPAQPYANASAAGNANYNDDKQNAFKASYSGLKAGWNTVLFALDAEVTDGTDVTSCRFRLGNVSNFKSGEKVLFDDFRFVNQEYIDTVMADHVAAKKVIGMLTSGLANLDVADAMAAYNALTDAQKAYVPEALVNQADDLKAGIDVQFRSMDSAYAIASYFHDRDGNDNAVFVDNEKFLEGTGSVGGVIKADAQDFYLFLHNDGTTTNAEGAAYLTLDVYVTKDNMLDGAEQYWSDVRGDDTAHNNANGEGYENVPLMSSINNEQGIRQALTGLKKGWNHVVIALDSKLAITDLVSMRLRLTSSGKMTNMTKGEEVLFDDIRLVSLDVLENVVPKRNAAKDVTAMIQEFPDVITLANEQAVADAKAAYDAVDPAYQSVVIGVDTLNAAVARIAELKESAASPEDLAAAKAVDDMITAIGTVTLDKEADIVAARAAYDALTDTQKNYVYELGALVAAEDALAVLKAQAADQAAADVVIAAIDALPTVDTVAIEDESAVRAADADYNALTKEQKTLVTNYSKIGELLAKIAELKLNQDVDPEGFVVDGVLDDFYKEDDGGMNVFHFSSQNGDIDTFVSDGGWDMYIGDVDHHVDFWTAYDDNFIYAYVRSFDTDLRKVEGDANRNDSIALYLDPDYMSRSVSDNPEGHFYVQTDDPNQGDLKFRLHGADLTLDDMSPNPKVFLGNMKLADYLANEKNFKAFYFDENGDGANDGYGFEVRIPRNDDSSKIYGINIACGSYRENYAEQYTYSFGKSWWMDYSSMVTYEFNDEYNPFLNDGPAVDPNKAAAEAVDALIDAIPTPVTADSRPAVEAARAAFDALTPLQKILVTKRAQLEEAEAILEDLDPSDPVRGDVNGDGATSAVDALEILKYVVGKAELTDAQKVVADVNGDGDIGAVDALEVLRIVVGKA